MFRYFDAAKVIVSHRFYLRQRVDKMMFLRVELPGDYKFIFLAFSELVYCVTRNTGVVPDLRLSGLSVDCVDCWFILTGSDKNRPVICRCFFCMLRIAMGDGFRYFARCGMYIAIISWDYILGGSY